MSWQAHFESLTGSPCCTKAHFLRWERKTRSEGARIRESGSSSTEYRPPPLIFKRPKHIWKTIFGETGRSYEYRGKGWGLRPGSSHNLDGNAHLFDEHQFPCWERAIPHLSALGRWPRTRRASS